MFKTQINALTYNISWATQINKVTGSEWDFVERCQKQYKDGGIQCNKNAIKNIGRLPQLDLVGLQEVNSNIEAKIQKVQPALKKFKRVSIGKSAVSILWNPDKLGSFISLDKINLTNSINDDRPLMILLLKNKDKHNVIINLHATIP